MGNTTHSLTYDAIGNPLTYGNGQQLYTNLTWEHGRELKHEQQDEGTKTVVSGGSLS